MKLLIDKIRLRLLLEEKREYINRPIDGIDTIVTALIYIASLLCSDFHGVFGVDKNVIATFAWIFAFGFLFYGVYQVFISLHRRYNHNALFADIENLNEILHRFSVVAIKDSFQDFPNRFLLYYDDAWSCWFFPNFHTSEFQNEQSICQRLSNQLKVDSKSILLRYIADRVQSKYSERDKINKVYQHSLYQATLFSFPEVMKSDEFSIDGINYKWWTISDMEKDPVLFQKNNDVISFVKEKL